jgi:outer membrane protein OmpA-like peptidoglycan-associated protein
MRWDDLKLLTVVPALLVSIIFLASCATPPPTQELADAEAAYADAEAAGCPECAPEECAAAQSALNKGRALASDFCSELEARRLLIDAKAKALEAQNKCSIPPPLAPIPGMKDIFFDFDRDNIRADAEAILQENAEVLKNNPDLIIVIEGYADLRGSVQYNIDLAQRRANRTKKHLEGLGIDGSRIEAIGVGETEIFGEGTSSDAYQLNRRSHFKKGMSPGALIYFKKAKQDPAS